AHAHPAKATAAAPPARTAVPSADRERLERVLQELVACRQLIDAAMKDG
ncbi:MerR family transcriptional regulator, partial [Escherichia coli]|nr:MerR family transcriptional regulator [Escherichia coli]